MIKAQYTHQQWEDDEDDLPEQDAASDDPGLEAAIAGYGPDATVVVLWRENFDPGEKPLDVIIRGRRFVFEPRPASEFNVDVEIAQQRLLPELLDRIGYNEKKRRNIIAELNHLEVPSPELSKLTDEERIERITVKNRRTLRADGVWILEELFELPGEDKRPRFIVLDNWVKTIDRNMAPGVWYCGVKFHKDKQGNVTKTELYEDHVCGPLYVDAKTADGNDDNHGRVLRFKNDTDNWRKWAMPKEVTFGSDDSLRKTLASMGLYLPPSKKDLLLRYITSEHPKTLIKCVNHYGWTDNTFVLPKQVIGPDWKSVIYQGVEAASDVFQTAGNLKGWRDNVAAKATGNPTLMFALSCAFVGPLLSLSGSAGGGFHFRGPSSLGKSTLMRAAASVWGGKRQMRSWNTTANGMEGVAVTFNDNVLVMDEISQADPRHIGQIVYDLANGVGKQRANRSGAARSVSEWRVFILSSGETTLETAMADKKGGGFSPKAGQEVRLIDIEVKRKFGAWDNLHGYENGAAFSDAVTLAAEQHYGHAGPAFIEWLTKESRNWEHWLREFKSVFKPMSQDGQDIRAADRFALVAMAGEAATEAGVVPWELGEATEAALAVYRMWKTGRKAGNKEPQRIRDQLRAFIDRHGGSRFEPLHSYEEEHTAVIRDRAGWKESDGSRYYFTKDGMTEALHGHTLKTAVDILAADGIIVKPDKGDGKMKQKKIKGSNDRFYWVDCDKLMNNQD
jgi:putative DNA primase/helicase